MASNGMDVLAELCLSCPPTASADAGSQLGLSDKEKLAYEKKQLKRAANRKSAQLSRKRKKQVRPRRLCIRVSASGTCIALSNKINAGDRASQYIEELKEQNSDLRKRIHILRHVPDMVVVFNIDDGTSAHPPPPLSPMSSSNEGSASMVEDPSFSPRARQKVR